MTYNSSPGQFYPLQNSDLEQLPLDNSHSNNSQPGEPHLGQLLPNNTFKKGVRVKKEDLQDFSGSIYPEVTSRTKNLASCRVFPIVGVSTSDVSGKTHPLK